MKPITGVVVVCRTRFIKIETEFGKTIHHQPIEGIERGDTVEIDYDFTNNRVEAIRLKGTQHSGDPIDPKLETEVPDPEAEQEELPQEGEGTLSCPSKETERREEEEDTLSLPAWDEDDGIVPEIVGPND